MWICYLFFFLASFVSICFSCIAHFDFSFNIFLNWNNAHRFFSLQVGKSVNYFNNSNNNNIFCTLHLKYIIHRTISCYCRKKENISGFAFHFPFCLQNTTDYDSIIRIRRFRRRGHHVFAQGLWIIGEWWRSTTVALGLLYNFADESVFFLV